MVRRELTVALFFHPYCLPGTWALLARIAAAMHFRTAWRGAVRATLVGGLAVAVLLLSAFGGWLQRTRSRRAT